VLCVTLQASRNNVLKLIDLMDKAALVRRLYAADSGMNLLTKPEKNLLPYASTREKHPAVSMSYACCGTTAVQGNRPTSCLKVGGPLFYAFFRLKTLAVSAILRIFAAAFQKSPRE